MINGRQRQRHGVTKNLVEGLGGLLVGAAAVLLLRQWLGQRRAKAEPASPATTAHPAGVSQTPGP